MKTFPTPHDSFFRKFFSDVSVAADFLQIHLPAPLQAKCDFGTLAITSGSFVEADMRNQISDILYSMKTPMGTGYIYCLIEHQSSPDEMMAFRLLRYSLAAMHRHLKQGHKRLPLIIPILFYHGKQSPYPYSMRWLDCFDDPAAAQHLYTQAFPLVDVTVIPDDEIKTHRKVALLEYVQKHIHERDINSCLMTIAWLIEKFKPSKEQVQNLIHYITQEGNALDPKRFLRILEQSAPRNREDMMKIADYLRQEGMKKGMQKGMQKGIQKGIQKGMQKGLQEGGNKREREIARKLLSLSTDRTLVEQATGLSRSEIDALMNLTAKTDTDR